MMAEKTIRGLLRNLTRQLSQKMPPDKALKLMEHQVRLAGGRRRCMAAKGCERLLPLPCGPGKHRPVECLRATSAATVVAHSPPPQSTTRRVGSVPPDLHAVAARSTCSASLSYSSFSRHSSKAGAVCVKAPIRICAGGDQ